MTCIEWSAVRPHPNSPLFGPLRRGALSVDVALRPPRRRFECGREPLSFRDELVLAQKPRPRAECVPSDIGEALPSGRIAAVREQHRVCSMNYARAISRELRTKRGLGWPRYCDDHAGD